MKPLINFESSEFRVFWHEDKEHHKNWVLCRRIATYSTVAEALEARDLLVNSEVPTNPALQRHLAGKSK